MAGLVLARGGSKGIPLKNIAPLGCKPLVAWCLQSMQEFGKFDSIWVSTDHQAIAECAQACGAKVLYPANTSNQSLTLQVFNRKPENATDTATSISAAQEFIESQKEVDVVCLIQVWDILKSWHWNKS